MSDSGGTHALLDAQGEKRQTDEHPNLKKNKEKQKPIVMDHMRLISQRQERLEP